jgi:hypothetical protein
MSLRALQRRVTRIEQARKPRPSPISRWYGSFDDWVELEVMPGIEIGALDGEFVAIASLIRCWESDGTWHKRLESL